MAPPATLGNLVPVLFFVRPLDAALKPRPPAPLLEAEAPVPLMPGKRLPPRAAPPPLSAVRDRPPPLLPRMPLPPPRAPKPFEKTPRPPPVKRESLGVDRDKLRRISAEEVEEEEGEVECSERV